MTKNDKEFKRNRQILAKQDYNKAKYEKYNIKNRFNSAEKKYFVEHDKQPEYNKLLKSRYLKEALEIFNKEKITVLFVLENSSSKKPIGIIHLHDCLSIY